MKRNAWMLTSAALLFFFLVPLSNTLRADTEQTRSPSRRLRNIGNSDNNSDELSISAIVGITVGSVFVACVFCTMCICCVYFCCCKRRRGRRERKKRSYNRVKITNPSDYYAYDAMAEVLHPVVIGPENLSVSTVYDVPTSSSTVCDVSPSTVYDVPATPTPQTRCPLPSLSGGLETDGTGKSRDGVDITLVEYTEIIKPQQTASTGEELYAQLESGSKTIKRNELEIDETGGRFSQGVWRIAGKNVKVHLRRCTAGEKTKHLQEASIMAQFNHPNVILFYGVLVDDLQVTIAEELLCGQLKNFLCRLRPKEPGFPVSRIAPKLLLTFSQQVALGMKYLASRGVIHGQLRASNVMLTRSNVCKITNFSLCSDIVNNSVSKADAISGWSAPEVLLHGRFSTRGDVWSYGCLLYEIWSLGIDPLDKEGTVDVLKAIKAGWRMSPPPGCPKVIYELMMESWYIDSDGRPSFIQLVGDLTRLEALVLSIPQKLVEQHPQCTELGAPLNLGKLMYRNIQTMYVVGGGGGGGGGGSPGNTESNTQATTTES